MYRDRLSQPSSPSTVFLPLLPNCSLSVGDGDDNTDAPCRAGHTAPYSQDCDQSWIAVDWCWLPKGASEDCQSRSWADGGSLGGLSLFLSLNEVRNAHPTSQSDHFKKNTVLQGQHLSTSTVVRHRFNKLSFLGNLIKGGNISRKSVKNNLARRGWEVLFLKFLYLWFLGIIIYDSVTQTERM